MKKKSSPFRSLAELDNYKIVPCLKIRYFDHCRNGSTPQSRSGIVRDDVGLWKTGSRLLFIHLVTYVLYTNVVNTSY